MPPRASIIIRCYNEEEHIGKLLAGIMAQRMGDFEIVLVDSGSTDATLAIGSRYPVKIVSIAPEEFSFGRSLNLGCQQAAGEFLVFASAHVYPVYNDWLEWLLKPFHDPAIALAYGKQRGDSEARFSEQRIFTSWYPEKSNPSQEIPFCNNANAAIRRDLWEKIPYDEKLTGLEDLDWAHRAIQQGYRIAYSAEAEIIHIHRESPRRTYNRYRREAMALKHIFPSQHFNLFDFVRLSIQNIASDCAAARRQGRLWGEFRSISAFRVLQFWGTYQGFRKPKPLDTRLKQQFYYPQARLLSDATSGDLERKPIDYTNPGG